MDIINRLQALKYELSQREDSESLSVQNAIEKIDELIELLTLIDFE